MKILTWNINGIRSVKSELKALFDSSSYDIICLQETKVTRDQLGSDSAIIDGYNSYFSFSRCRSGYSGVATFVKDTCAPVEAEEGITGLLAPDGDVIGSLGDQSEFSGEEINCLDREGRAVITQHKFLDEDGSERQLAIVNVYCPRADPENEERKQFKMQFCKLLQIRVEAILNSGSHVIILGDVNISHTKLDHCDPAEDKEFYSNKCRMWLTDFLWNPNRDGDLDKINTDSIWLKKPGAHFVDVFRYFHPFRPAAYTCWSTVTGSRATNYGTRIDYIFGDVDLVRKAFTHCDIMPEVQGSDHCPVWAALDWEIIPSKKCPRLCTKFMPEFAGKQQKLSLFFPKRDNSKACNTDLYQDVANSQDSDSGTVSEISQKTSNEQHYTFPRVDQKKRCSFESSQNDKKRKRVDTKCSKSKQGNLLNFFGKNHSSDTSNSGELETESLAVEERISDVTSNKHVIEDTDIKTQSMETKPQSIATSKSWKSLLKGPPTPPLCKGHQEPCALRTVKKDSLNKGRQFWVCARPEGHKSNPEARCEYFVWVKKR